MTQMYINTKVINFYEDEKILSLSSKKRITQLNRAVLFNELHSVGRIIGVVASQVYKCTMRRSPCVVALHAPFCLTNRRSFVAETSSSEEALDLHKSKLNIKNKVTK